ncbi:GGDEF domain-containing protein [Shewanella sp. SR43-4]|jgi:diguanylate cyclase (GGDEF)-like protein/PAS domain S-box-containing protein|uniref:diguanylate cyclase n=1 Tax=Shewanella vesiculosa TaxID=518738 RepID=A0ABV0FNL5_9GAMM|nr:MULTISPECIES: sensor domain-containing diguanylate cyclase [Shewanella]MBB1317423.1 GGDEF domain-containing protein [Shewanella sp. SR43-4]MBB1321589.1 GGDEF domain-containing protein [Shewanella sp. SR43-8]MBB1388414.1 GGDEF domain-containing protein [Shewanella sp. SG44-6]|tara:strand:+ start:1422 stop:2555 length:1134 start_codon:yes stop_codon:yes gene_type:complete
MFTNDKLTELNDTISRVTKLTDSLSKYPNAVKIPLRVEAETLADSSSTAVMFDATFDATSANQNGKMAVVDNLQIRTLLNVINAISEAIFVINSAGVIEMINPLGAKLFGAPAEMLIGQTWTDYLQSPFKDEYQSLFDLWNNASDQSNKVTQFNHGPKEIIINRADSTLLEADLSLSCLPSIQIGSEPLFIGIMHNLTSHKAEYNKLRHLAHTDKLTGLANRHAFDDALQTNWNDSINHDQPLCLIIIDVDYFKIFNDQFGHVNGDKCLQKIAQVLADVLPSNNAMAARYGGEEFVVILPNSNPLTAEYIAKNIQRRINQLTFTDIGLPAQTKISVSQGIACERSGQYRTPTALVCAADTALYRAKSTGRNRINMSS